MGRIVAIHNRIHNEFHEENAGFFGLFECIDDQAVANKLLETAESWVRERGATVVRGPMNLSTNDELWSPGVLIDGFDRPPAIMMGHTPGYYARLLDRAGYIKSKDLVALWIEGTERDRHTRTAERLMARANVRMRPIQMEKLDEEVELIQEIYNSAWERNWGFVPMTPEEIRHLAHQLKPVVNPNLCCLAFVGDEPAGFALALPDYNQVLRRMNGRLLPFGILKLLWYKRKITFGTHAHAGCQTHFPQQGSRRPPHPVDLPGRQSRRLFRGRVFVDSRGQRRNAERPHQSGCADLQDLSGFRKATRQRDGQLTRVTGTTSLTAGLHRGEVTARPVDRLLGAYAASGILPLLFPHRPSTWPWIAAIHALAAWLLLGLPPASGIGMRLSRSWPRAWSVLADCYPLALIPFLYEELPALNSAIWNGRYFDPLIQHLEVTFFGGQPSRAWAASMPVLPLSEMLHAAYLSYYFIIFAPPFLIWWKSGRPAFRQAVFALLLAFLVHYLFFIGFRWRDRVTSLQRLQV